MYKHSNGICYNKLSEKDLHLCKQIRDDCWPYTNRTLFVSDDDCLKWFRSIPDDTLIFIGSDEKNSSLGLLIFNRVDQINRTAEISGYISPAHKTNSLNPRYMKKGWVSGTDFGFEVLNLHTMSCQCVAHNPMCKLLGNLGYYQCGVLKESVYKFGLYVDSFIFQITRTIWEQRPDIYKHSQHWEAVHRRLDRG